MNRRLHKILQETRKVLPLEELFNDTEKFMAFIGPAFIYDEAVSTKLVVNFQLYYKTIEILGTEKHKHWKRRCEDGLDIGCFGLTELGHGSNVKGIQTTAQYDHANKEFILHTPSEKAMKFWIGGAGKASNVAAIFAQLIVGNKSYGPHAFLVQIRNKDTHHPCPGVMLGDCGRKEGLDGVDNGFIIFNNYRIPKENLLNRFGCIDEKGSYGSCIERED